MVADDPIERSDEILGGTPVFRGTRVPIRAVFDYLEAGERLDDFLEDFPTVSHAQVIELLQRVRALVLR